MIRLALGMNAILTMGMALILCLVTASPCQAQTASNETAEATEPTVVASTNTTAISPNWSRALKGYALFPPTTQVTGPSGPAPQGSINDRFKTREHLAPIRESYAAIGIGSKHINAIVGGFEQGAGLGFGIEATTADKFSWVELRAMALTTTIFYTRFMLEAEFPSIGDEQTHANVWFNYLLADRINFYGIGPRTPESLRTNFQLEQRSINGLLQRDFTDRLKAGVYFTLANAGASNGDDEDLAPINLFFSGSPTVEPITRWAPGLDMNSEIISYGLYGEYDGRNNERGLTKGFYFYGLFGNFDGLNNGRAFSDFGWLQTVLDGRVYIPLGSDNTSFAARAFTSLQNPKGGSQIPFYYQSFIGGRSFVRGFRTFRFRGDNALVLSTELRQTVWTQQDDRGLDVHGFGDAGQVWGDNRSSVNPVVLANDDFNSSNWRFGVGGGFTYRYNEQFAIRIEIGHSNEGNRVYVSLTRGF